MNDGRRSRRRNGRDRRGTAYVIVLGMATLVGVMAIGTLGLTRTRGRAGAESMDAADARQCALDGVEIAKLWIRRDVNWRTNRTAGAWTTNLPTGPGTVTIEVSDPVDGNLAKGQHDSLLVKCTGKKGLAKHILSVTLRADPVPIDALAHVLHVGGELHLVGSQTLTSGGATVSTNDHLQNLGVITGGIHVASVQQLGTVLGTPIVTNAPQKPMPAATVINNYVALGTEIGSLSAIQNCVLAPGYNPFSGGTNADGIYIVRPAGDLSIKSARIYGTLIVILNSGRTLKIDDQVLLHPSRTDQPTLIVKGDAILSYASGSSTLSETLTLANFNPPEAPYNGVSNLLPTDVYPSEIQGLVHITGKLMMEDTARVRGAVIVESTLSQDAFTTNGPAELIYTPSLFTSPPQWYTKEVRMPIQAASWSQPAN